MILVCQIGEMKKHLYNTGVAKALTSVVATNEDYADVRDKVARLTSMIDSGWGKCYLTTPAPSLVTFLLGRVFHLMNCVWKERVLLLPVHATLLS